MPAATHEAPMDVTPQRRRVVLSKDNIRLKPGQYLIKTPEVTRPIFDGQKRQVGEERVPYDGTAYGVKFENNIAVIDDESVREIREVMLAELEGDEARLPPWFRSEEGSAIALARKIQSDFGYEITPELPKLRKMSKAEIAASMPYDETDELTAEQAAGDKPGQHTENATKHAASRPVPGVDDKGLEEGREGMPAEPPSRAGKPAPAKPLARSARKH